jgi:hypothetical protein
MNPHKGPPGGGTRSAVVSHSPQPNRLRRLQLYPGPHTPGTSDQRRDCAQCAHEKNTKKALDLGKHCARGGTRTGFHPLNFRHSPENLRNPASGASTSRSEAQGVHIVHTRFRRPNQAAYTAVRAGRVCLARDFVPIRRVGPLTRPRTSTAPGSGPDAEIDDNHGGGFLLSEHLMEKRTATCMTTRQSGSNPSSSG